MGGKEYFGPLVAVVHKITNVPLILKIWDITFVLGKLVYGPFLGIF
jgi:hypothetical protein